MANFNQRLNSVLTDLSMICAFLQRLDEDSGLIDLKYQNELLIRCFDILSQQAENLVLDSENYGLIKRINWKDELESPVYFILQSSLTKTSIQLNSKSSLDPLLASLVANAKSIKLLYQFENHKKFPLIYDNLFQLDDCVNYLILLLINCNYCSEKAKSDIVNLNLHPEIQFSNEIFKSDQKKDLYLNDDDVDGFFDLKNDLKNSNYNDSQVLREVMILGLIVVSIVFYFLKS